MRPAPENIDTVYDDDTTPKEERIRSSCYKLPILLPENPLKLEPIWLNIQTIEECVPHYRPQLPGLDTYQDIVNDPGKYMVLPQVDPQERFGRKFVICMSDSTAPAPKNVCIAKLISGYECNSVLGDLFSRNYIIAEAYLTEKQDPFNPSSEYSEAVFYHITLADLRHAFKKFSKSSNIFDSDKTNSYYVRKEAE
jgi:hypothetical protein